MSYCVRPMTPDDGEAIALWRYPGPWAVYDSTGPLDPAEGYWAVVDDAGELVGFACFGVEARVSGLEERAGVLDVGVGMRPDLTGQGRGVPFSEAVFAHGREVAPRMRAVVQQWNERSVRLLRRLGFEETGHHDVGQTRYVVLERST
ncbi:MAG: GNAT family N-acetyltransferase [Nocardioidaceae bacterium]